MLLQLLTLFLVPLSSAETEKQRVPHVCRTAFRGHMLKDSDMAIPRLRASDSLCPLLTHPGHLHAPRHLCAFSGLMRTRR